MTEDRLVEERGDVFTVHVAVLDCRVASVALGVVDAFDDEHAR
ncbi:hypothetical protein AB0L53_24850 [Nonomuraea sp. NPDC052129]